MGRKKGKFRLVAFDLDGTIIDEVEFIWLTIHDHLATDRQKRLCYRKQYFSNKISYEEWARMDVKLWEQAGAGKREIMKALSSIRLMKGARQTLLELKKRGYKLAIISGILNIAVEKVLPEYKKIFDYILLNKIYFRKNGKILRIVPTKFDTKHKLTGLRMICRKEGISLKQSVFIGDNWNDVHVAKKSGLAIAFNCRNRELLKVCDVAIRKKDLRKVLPYL